MKDLDSLFMLFTLFIVFTIIYIDVSYRHKNAEDKDRQCYVYLLLTIPLVIVLIDTMYASLGNTATANITTILLVTFLISLIITNIKSRGLVYHKWYAEGTIVSLIMVSILVVAINVVLTMEPNLVHAR